MLKIGITGSNGFIGKNLRERLSKNTNITVKLFNRELYKQNPNYINDFATDLDLIYHLAGVNRPQDNDEFYEGNSKFTKELIQALDKQPTKAAIVFSSAIHVELDNDYGKSKKNCETAISEYALKNKVQSYIYRLPNIFGKWCKPFYNSVVATFCYQIARNNPITIHEPDKKINLIHIDQVIDLLLSHINKNPSGEKNFANYISIDNCTTITVGELASKLEEFNKNRHDLIISDIKSDFDKRLYSTFLHYLEQDKFNSALTLKTDDRGSLVEVFKSRNFGQIFFSTSKPGITRGNHYHNLKIEKFCVLRGKARISFRDIYEGDVFDYIVNGDNPQIVDIPPGYTHNITNIGDNDILLLVWASEIFDPDLPDTYFEKV